MCILEIDFCLFLFIFVNWGEQTDLLFVWKQKCFFLKRSRAYCIKNVFLSALDSSCQYQKYLNRLHAPGRVEML